MMKGLVLCAHGEVGLATARIINFKLDYENRIVNTKLVGYSSIVTFIIRLVMKVCTRMLTQSSQSP